MLKAPISSLNPFVIEDGCGGNHPTCTSMEKWMLNDDDELLWFGSIHVLSSLVSLLLLPTGTNRMYYATIPIRVINSIKSTTTRAGNIVVAALSDLSQLNAFNCILMIDC